jgi:hypothetical protein
VDEVGVVLEVSARFVSGGAMVVAEVVEVGFGADVTGAAGQDPGGLDADPVLGRGIGGGVETPRGRPQLLDHVDDVEDDVDRDVAPGCLGLDQLPLVGGAVNQYYPGPVVLGVAGFGLVERGGDDRFGVFPDGGGEPFRPCDGSFADGVVSGAAAGRGDDVVRAADCRFRVVVILLRRDFSPVGSRVRKMRRALAAASAVV